MFNKKHVPWNKGNNICCNSGRTHFKRGDIPWNKGKCQTQETKEKLSKAQIGKHSSPKTEFKKGCQIGLKTQYKKGNIPWINGKHHTSDTRKKLREAHLKYLSKKFNNGEPIYPVVGKQETIILDILEKEILGYKILRQYKIDGYYLDGYCPELNLVIEVDEKYHKNQKEKDTERDNYIKHKLNCSILRIPIGV